MLDAVHQENTYTLSHPHTHTLTRRPAIRSRRNLRRSTREGHVHTVSLSHTLSHTLTHTGEKSGAAAMLLTVHQKDTHTLSLSLSRTRAHTHTHTHTHAYTHTHTHTHTHSHTHRPTVRGRSNVKRSRRGGRVERR